jgi:hypothetical protein
MGSPINLHEAGCMDRFTRNCTIYPQGDQQWVFIYHTRSAAHKIITLMRVKKFPYSWLRKQEQGEANKSLFVLILYTLGTLYNSRFDYWMPLCTRGVLDYDHECLNPSQAFTWPAAQKSFSSCQELDIIITLTYNAVCGDDVQESFQLSSNKCKTILSGCPPISNST